MGIETERELAFHCPLGEDKLMVRSFAGSEHLGSNFEYSVLLFSKEHDIDLESLLGQSCTVEVKFGSTEPRYFNGIACEFSHQGRDEDYALYRVVLRPWFWLLSRNRECRIFQSMTTLEIAKKIFEERGFSDCQDHLFIGLTSREYCVQFSESDFDFISRLFEYEGIYYYFKHEKDKHTMVLADSFSSHEATPGYEEIAFGQMLREREAGLGQFTDWTVTKQIQAGAVKLNDFNFKKSRADITAPRSNPKSHQHADSELYIFPGRYYEPANGMDNAVVRLEEVQTPFEVAHGVTDCRGLSAGALFTLIGHPRGDQDREYLIVHAHYTIDSGQYRSGGVSTLQMLTHVHVMDAKQQYRPARVTPVPFVPGPQTARVVGPKGQEIWTDNFGRVKVQFAWDHEGKFDEKSSCFVRVSQTWAGKDWGAWHIPRIGQEVLVDFLDGDLDRPVIIGRVHNDYNVGAWNLPDQATRSGFKTHSIEGGKDDYNELRFEDAKAQEEIFIRAQRNMTTRVRNNRHAFIGNNDTRTVKKNVKLEVQEGDCETTTHEGLIRHQAPKNLFEVSAKEIVCTAEDALTLKVGDCTILVDSKGIRLSVGQGTEVMLGPATLQLISKLVDINPIACMPQGPATPADPPDAEENTEKFNEGNAGARGMSGGSSGGGGAGGSYSRAGG